MVRRSPKPPARGDYPQEPRTAGAGELYRVGQLNPPALSGSDILKVVYGATFRFDKAALIDELNDMADRVRLQWQEGKRLAARPRILITGCPIGGAAEKVVKAIEDNGGWVVGFENCTGAKATERCVEETGDVYDALTDKYLAIGCSCISPNDQRLSCLARWWMNIRRTAW